MKVNIFVKNVTFLLSEIIRWEGVTLAVPFSEIIRWEGVKLAVPFSEIIRSAIT